MLFSLDIGLKAFFTDIDSMAFFIDTYCKHFALVVSNFPVWY